MKYKDVQIIIQARLGSSRLPRKVLLYLGDRTVLERVYESAKNVAPTIVAIPSKDLELEEFLRDHQIPYFKGDELDVLKRYHDCAQRNPARHIVRITSDCPLLPEQMIETVIKAHLEGGTDYTSNVAFRRTFPKGFDVEAFTKDALERAHFAARDPYDREHVTPWIQKYLKVKPVFQEIDQSIFNCSLDTQQDYENLKRLI